MFWLQFGYRAFCMGGDKNCKLIINTLILMMIVCCAVLCRHLLLCGCHPLTIYLCAGWRYEHDTRNEEQEQFFKSGFGVCLSVGSHIAHLLTIKKKQLQITIQHLLHDHSIIIIIVVVVIICSHAHSCFWLLQWLWLFGVVVPRSWTGKPVMFHAQ